MAKRSAAEQAFEDPRLANCYEVVAILVAGLHAIIATAPKTEPIEGDYDDTESAFGNGGEVAAWEAAEVANLTLRRASNLIRPILTSIGATYGPNSEAAEAALFGTADLYWRRIDPDNSADTPGEALHQGAVGNFIVCEVASAFIGPTRYGFNAPVLDPNSDGKEFLHFATQEEALAAARERHAAMKKEVE